MASTASSSLSLEDFKPGERVWWDGNQSRFFATVVRIDETAGELILEFDSQQGSESVVTSEGSKTDPEDSRIVDWHKIPDIAKIQEGTLLSTNSGFFTWDETGQTRYVFKVTKVEPEKVSLEKWGMPAYKTTLRGNDFSRTLEDALYEWEVESYEPVEALNGWLADTIIESLADRKLGGNATSLSKEDRKAIEETERKVEMQHRLHLENTYATGIPSRSLNKLYETAWDFDTYSLLEGGYGPYSALEHHYKKLAGLVSEILSNSKGFSSPVS